MEGEWRDWSCVPVGILDLIVSKASFQDVHSFRAVCRQWRRSYYPQNMGFGSQWQVQSFPLESTLRLFHPLVDRPFTIAAELRGVFVRCSKDGWLLMSKGYHIFFFYPFSNSTIQLPDLPGNPDHLTGFTFTCHPTSEDCLVFGVGIHAERSGVILALSRNKKNWSRTIVDSRYTYFFLSHTNPVYHGGKLYYLHFAGDVGVFDPNGNDGSGKEFECFIKLGRQSPGGGVGPPNYFLECNGKLLGVFLYNAEVKVCELDESTGKWQKIDDLGEYMLFVSNTTCFARRSARRRMRNRIYFPIFNANGHMVFYCMEQGLCRTFESDSPIYNFDETKLLLGCCWMEPTKSHNSNTVSWVDAESWEGGGDDSDDTNSTISAEADDDFDFSFSDGEQVAFYFDGYGTDNYPESEDDSSIDD